MSATVVLTVSYDGSDFSGFARQPERRTVQGELEDALRTALRRDAETVGAGRTDAGVHALGQVVSFSLVEDEPTPELDRLARSLDALTGPDIAVTAARLARDGFSARHDALSREYRYRLVAGPARPLFLSRHAWWVASTLDLDVMRRAAAPLVGRHDFRSFCVSESAEVASTTMREVEVLEIGPAIELGEECVVVRVVGRSFLHSMVRAIVGSLVEVGRGARPEEWVAEGLAARDRSAAGPTAPAHGLTLWRVDYPADVWR